MKKLAEEIKMSVFLIVLTSLCTLLLTSGNIMYQRVLGLQEQQMRIDILRDFGVSFTEDSFDTLFDTYVEVRDEKAGTFYYFNGEPRQVTIITSGSGLWSVIEMMLTIDLTTARSKELRVLAHGETPGLGGRITEDWFSSQFRDLDISRGVKLVHQKSGEAGEADAITGATETSNSVMNIINTALSILQITETTR